MSGTGKPSAEENTSANHKALDSVLEHIPGGHVVYALFVKEGKIVKQGWFAFLVIASFAFIGGCEWRTVSIKKENDRQALQQAFAGISGEKKHLRDLLVLHRNQAIHTGYFSRLWELEGAPKDSQNHIQMREQWVASDDTKKSISAAEKDFFQNLGTIRLLCANDKEVINSARDLEHVTDFGKFSENHAMNASELDKWKTELFNGKEKFVDDNFAKPVDALLKQVDLNFQKR